MGPGVSKRSVDTWMHGHLFHMDCSTGAPPDYFDARGQNWGFPTYNWEEMAKDGYAWWRSRLTHMAQYFHAYRIDHILGFFRIWEIPSDCVTGLLGHFRPSIPETRAQLEAAGIWDIDRCETFLLLITQVPAVHHQYLAHLQAVRPMDHAEHLGGCPGGPGA